MSREPETKDRHPLPRLRRWYLALQGCNVPDVQKADALSRWLVVSRACVLPMTLTSAFIGILLAVARGPVHWLHSLLAVIGLLAAHASNNMLNDWTDLKRGVDTPGSPRAQYSVHPVLGGLASPAVLLRASILLLVLDAAIMIFLALKRGWPIVGFSLAGLCLSLAYTGFLKRYALGELTSLVVWGPLMIGGTAFAAGGRLDRSVWLASLPYGLIVASVLIGKHIDKREADQRAGVHSLPVLLGEKASRILSQATFLAFYALVGLLLILGASGPWVLVTAVAAFRLARAWKAFSRPRPAEPPEDWPVWPLWYVGWAMYFNRRAGELLVLGLLLNLVVPLPIA